MCVYNDIYGLNNGNHVSHLRMHLYSRCVFDEDDAQFVPLTYPSASEQQEASSICIKQAGVL